MASVALPGSRKLSHWLYGLVLVIVATSLLGFSKAAAQPLDNRSVSLGNATASAVDSYSFSFTVPTNSSLGSIVFEYCSNSPIFSDSCTPPAGLDSSNPTLVNQTGNIGFTVDSADTTANQIVLSRPASAGIQIASIYDFDNITNPSASGATTFVRISLHSSLDGSGPANDQGSVAFVTASQFSVGAFVPPFLKMCVGITVSPTCASVSGDSINLGNLSSGHASAGQSQFSAGTNSPTGYAVYGLGTTMTSGNNFIWALNIPSTSFPGTGQFGLNLRANLSPAVGADPIGLGVATPTANYNTPNRFMFSNGDMLAQSTSPSDYNRMTVSYLVNVPGSQPSGVYSTTITFQAVAQF